MKRFFKIAVAGILICFFATFAGYSAVLRETDRRLSGVRAAGDAAQAMKYHFVIVTQNTGDAFWVSVRKGARQAGQDYGAAVEFNGSLVKDEAGEIQYFQIAVASKVDGIALYVTDRNKFTGLIDKAAGQGIPVVTIESDDRSSRRAAYVGPNSYGAGVSEARLAGEASEEWTKGVRAALIVGGNYIYNNDADNELIEGFYAGLASLPRVRLEATKIANSGYFGAELCIRDILFTHPDVNMVICTGTDDTMEVEQVLLDLNKKQQVTVLGYGNTAEIRDYIRNGDIYGSVYEDPYEMGYSCIRTLVRSAGGQKVGDPDYTGVYTLTRSNLVNYPGNE